VKIAARAILAWWHRELPTEEMTPPRGGDLIVVADHPEARRRDGRCLHAAPRLCARRL